jgi:membrane protein YqaA with SNARE-associated domain
LAWLHDLSDWLLGFAESGWAIGILVLSTFTESIFNPIPPDPLLIAIAVLQPHNAIWLALLATGASVAGAFVGHWLGGRLGRPIAERLFPEKYIARGEALFERYGVWAILIAAFTPVPYKVFAILAGVLGFDRKLFLIASLVGRGARFLLIGALILAFGEEIEAWVEGNLAWITGAAGAAIIAAVVAFVIYRVWRSRRPATGANGGTPGRESETP